MGFSDEFEASSRRFSEFKFQKQEAEGLEKNQIKGGKEKKSEAYFKAHLNSHPQFKNKIQTLCQIEIKKTSKLPRSRSNPSPAQSLGRSKDFQGPHAILTA